MELLSQKAKSMICDTHKFEKLEGDCEICKSISDVGHAGPRGGVIRVDILDCECELRGTQAWLLHRFPEKPLRPEPSPHPSASPEDE